MCQVFHGWVAVVLGCGKDIVGVWKELAEPVPGSLDYANSQDIETLLGERSSLVEANNIQLATHVDSLRADTEDLLLL